MFEFNSIDLNQLLDRRSRIACVPFNTTYCMQPFQVTVSTNVLLLVDFHSHLISAEVCGYLAGSWDPRLQHLSITQAYPLRERSIVAQKAHVCRIQQSVLEKGLVVVGWYHSHPNTFPHPSVADIRKQLQYQKQFLTNRRGQGEYSPCVGLIISPFYQRVSQKPTSLFQLFWVMPVFTSHNQDIGRPMQLSYSLSRDAFLTQDLLVEMVEMPLVFVCLTLVNLILFVRRECWPHTLAHIRNLSNSPNHSRLISRPPTGISFKNR